MTSSVSGKDKPNPALWLARAIRNRQYHSILPARDCPFCSRNKISPKLRRAHENFLSQNIFHDSKRIFYDFSVGMELEKAKPKASTRMKKNMLMNFKNTFWNKNRRIQKQKHKATKRRGMSYNKSFIEQTMSRWLDIGLVLSWRFYGSRLRLGPWKRKKRTRPMSSYLDLALAQEYTIPGLPSGIWHL